MLAAIGVDLVVMPEVQISEPEQSGRLDRLRYLTRLTLARASGQPQPTGLGEPATGVRVILEYLNLERPLD